MELLLTGTQSRELDYHAIHQVGFPGLVLMEKAAMTLAKVLLERETEARGVLFVCGMGNNGGDGMAAARLLHQQGVSVAILLVGDLEHMSPDARKQMELAAACGVRAEKETAINSPSYDILVDGLFGVGLTREVGGIYREIIEKLNASRKKIYAIDVPSGIHADDGAVMGTAVKAQATVTFGANKMGLVLYPGCSYAGEVTVGDIGYPQVSYEAIGTPAHYYEKEDLLRLLPARKPDGHKGTFGHAAVIGGSPSMSGAAFFSAKAAYLVGAGLVKICSCQENRNLLMGQLPEALVSSYEDETGEPDFAALDEIMDFADAVVLGPGLGQSRTARRIVNYVMERCKKLLILDGDGLTLCEPQLFSSCERLILTPHPREFSTISQKTVTELKEQFVRHVVSFAEKHHCIMVGKDARTIVSDGREIYVNVTGNSGMGTGGSGDVLTGLIAGFAAQGMEYFDAARLGVYVHGLAGDSFVSSYNEYSLTATGLLDEIKNIL